MLLNENDDDDDDDDGYIKIVTPSTGNKYVHLIIITLKYRQDPSKSRSCCFRAVLFGASFTSSAFQSSPVSQPLKRSVSAAAAAVR